MVTISFKNAAIGAVLLAGAAGLLAYPLFKPERDLDGWTLLNTEVQQLLEQQVPAGGPASVPPDEAAAAPPAGGPPAKVPQPAAKNTPGPAEPLDINRATASQLERLPGIGPSRAKAIVQYRTQSGPFRSKEELRKVKGIGPKLFDGLKDAVTVGSVDSS